MTNTFGKILRELRRSKGVSQRELAAKVGVDFSYISKLENDRLPPPAADTIMRICEVLTIPTDELLGITGKIPTKVKKMLSSSPSAIGFIQQAYEMNLTESDWEKMVQELKRLRRD